MGLSQNKDVHEACQIGYLDQVAELLEKDPSLARLKGSMGRTPLHYAASHGFKDCVHLLLSNGAEIEAKDNDGWTALMGASIWGHTGVVVLLLQNGAHTDAHDVDGVTALMMASVEGHLSVVSLLLEANAAVDAKNKDGSTALMWASWQGRTEAAALLLEHGANVKLENTDGETALKGALALGHQEVVELLLQHLPKGRRNSQLQLLLKAVDEAPKDPINATAEHDSSEKTNDFLAFLSKLRLDSFLSLRRNSRASSQCKQDDSDAIPLTKAGTLADHEIPKFYEESPLVSPTVSIKSMQSSGNETPKSIKSGAEPRPIDDSQHEGCLASNSTESVQSSIQPSEHKKPQQLDLPNKSCGSEEPKAINTAAQLHPVDEACLASNSKEVVQSSMQHTEPQQPAPQICEQPTEHNTPQQPEPSSVNLPNETKKADVITALPALFRQASIKKMNRQRLSILEGVLKGFLEDIEKTRHDRRNTEELCCICLYGVKSTVLLPCKHLCICARCSEKDSLVACPVCCTIIEDRIVIFS